MLLEFWLKVLAYILSGLATVCSSAWYVVAIVLVIIKIIGGIDASWTYVAGIPITIFLCGWLFGFLVGLGVHINLFKL